MSERANPSLVLRTIADLLDQHPDISPPSVIPKLGLVFWHLYEWEHPDISAAAADLRRTLGGAWDKDYSGEDLILAKVADGITYKIHVKRDSVCTRRVVGTKTVTLPAVKAAPKRTIEEEIVEWDCAPILADAVSA